MSWATIARAYERGYTLPKESRKPRKSKDGIRWVTVAGETKSLAGWHRDPRNVYHVSSKTLSKRAKHTEELHSLEWWFRKPLKQN